MSAWSVHVYHVLFRCVGDAEDLEATPQELRGLLIGVLHIIVKVAEFIAVDVHNQQTQAARILRSGQALLIDTPCDRWPWRLVHAPPIYR